jgi:RNA polymerase sigma-70 factor (ECF subfamily)
MSGALTDAELQDLYRRTAPALLHRCRGILRDEALAQDAVHETFARVIRSWADFRRASSPMTWMYRISTNLCLNALRDRSGRDRLLDRRADELAPQGSVTPGEVVLSDHERLRDLLAEADEETRRIVVHIWFDDCTREEVAELVGLSVPTVRKRLDAFLATARVALSAAVLLLFGVMPW